MALAPPPCLPRPDYTCSLSKDEKQYLGRRPINDLVLNDPSVSADHVWVIRSQHGGESVFVEDLDSSNGTFRVYEDRCTRLQPRHIYIVPIGTLLRFGKHGPVVSLSARSEEAVDGGA